MWYTQASLDSLSCRAYLDGTGSGRQFWIEYTNCNSVELLCGVIGSVSRRAFYEYDF